MPLTEKRKKLTYEQIVDTKNISLCALVGSAAMHPLLYAALLTLQQCLAPSPLHGGPFSYLGLSHIHLAQANF